jgi:hypothetical protein
VLPKRWELRVVFEGAEAFKSIRTESPEQGDDDLCGDDWIDGKEEYVTGFKRWEY